MKVLFLFCYQLFVWTLAQEYYDRRYDYYAVDSLIQNPRLLKKYLICFLDRGPCPPIGRIFKALLPEVITTACAKCSPRQKVFAGKVVKAFDRYLPDYHDELRKKYDPQNKYYAAFEKAIGVTK